MKHNINFSEERKGLGAIFRWAERINLYEGVANHFSFNLNNKGTEFLMNPNMWHFSQIKSSDFLLLYTDDGLVLQKENPPDATAWFDHSIEKKTACELNNEEHPNPEGTAFLREIKNILDKENSDY